MTAKEFLRSKGISADLKTLRLTTRVEDGLIVDWMDEYANQRVIEELEELLELSELNEFTLKDFVFTSDIQERIKELKQ